MEQDPLTEFHARRVAPLVALLKQEGVQRRVYFAAAAALAVILVFYIVVERPPRDFPEKELVRVTEGSSLSEVAVKLERENVVRSAFWLKGIVVVLGGEANVQAGDYFFEKPEGIFTIAYRISRGIFHLDLIKVTIPEGATAAEVALILGEKLGSFDIEKFANNGQELEGYLFPDTYFFLPNVATEDVITVMQQNFFRKVTTLAPEIASFGKPLEEIIIMASLLEKEARRLETKRLIAGILWKRLEIGMALQVDATFRYINGKGTFELTLEDLQINSPYNTYRFVGLPPGPIANPGLDSILAAATPTESEYLFYLADRQGETHYSATFEEHQRKKALYLD